LIAVVPRRDEIRVEPVHRQHWRSRQRHEGARKRGTALDAVHSVRRVEDRVIGEMAAKSDSNRPRRHCSCCLVLLPAIISTWAEVARHRRRLICSRRYRLGDPRRRLIARRHGTQAPLTPRQQPPPFRTFCPKICQRRSRSFRIKSSTDWSRRCSLSRSDVVESLTPLRTHASSGSSRVP
jgi:hypothetical protein